MKYLLIVRYSFICLGYSGEQNKTKPLHSRGLYFVGGRQINKYYKISYVRWGYMLWKKSKAGEGDRQPRDCKYKESDGDKPHLKK